MRAMPLCRCLPLAAAAVLSLGWPAPAAAETCGKVLVMKGTAMVERGGQTQPLTVNEDVDTGDTIEAPGDAKVRLRMNDGSILTVAADGRLSLDKYAVDGSGRRQEGDMTMLSGTLRAVVNAGTGTPDFEVKTTTAVAAARGTEWYVETQGDTTQVSVVSGTVSLAGADGRAPETLPPMSTAGVAANQAPSAVRPLTQAELAALVERTSLGAGLCQCIAIKDAELASCRLSPQECEALCGSHYSFVPAAGETCGSR
ncbi:MAG TPA: FecR family protein [Stellaceae bacterium]|nr:FecR family protein [Stellaceae bacterium]